MILEPCSRSQRFEVVLDQLAPGWIVLRVGRIPALLAQQSLGCFVDVVEPGREHAHVRPLPHGMPNAVASLQARSASSLVPGHGLLQQGLPVHRRLRQPILEHSTFVHPSGYIEIFGKTLTRPCRP